MPNLDPVYQDLDGLIAAGWVKTAIVGQRPYSRLTVARLVVAARANVAKDGGLQRPRFREALDRLEGAFASEIRALCVGEGVPCALLGGNATLRSATADATWADSPGRRIPTSYDSVGAHYIDAELKPLLQKNQGLNHQGGSGGPPATFAERLQDIFLIYPQGQPISDKVFGADVRLTLPAAGLQLYMEVLTTDDHELFSSPEPGVGERGRVDSGSQRQRSRRGGAGRPLG